ncbi:3'(2'),5'-bisphosphate nucleotidase CysQ [Piscirickettsia salmonis]|uniref:3'(2'),5'-bisphosphate nucleotidase CysQ n=1 Tax=Piscirickettsia salmonis TaxID=1238 RepID=A0A1L6TET8_PISSA|nr:3'(2'),5'-bisphosphate nucleotidase CysQ [Piscirickettsia salmonis]AKP72586.1 3'(2'),5'-bisphosphate nucleotidase CysQ [Piscirickettsia salmonis LF-89 = ATCC VR-1361]ALB23930.1 3'(2'),5'-bisphosphate nucleotidase [Piscirickettsia salmonis]AOS35789.1 3'(2'),5'-bisphosphate nucleotidase CysQ [Piscirickettsia salmonis]APS60493.1 3'(2'),5'-bisphosphate nucleotidase CysQ [Piscirickettsia salmonis]APS63726.1 3'(2'),5'-bisphosphate nucleotidase CysQ [Piscirickettsia salmonis]
MEKQALLDGVIALSKKAGCRVLDVYKNLDSVEIAIKADATPVISADLESHEILMTGLSELAPRYPILSEERVNVPFSEREHWSCYWLVDPLDGTREFIRGNDEFTINVALIENGQPILGVVYVPVTGQCYFACAGKGAFVQQGDQPAVRICSQPYQQGEKIRLVAGHWHDLERLAKFTRQFPQYSIEKMGSALKLCLIAEGRADLCLRLVPSSEWDMAAAHIILSEAGGDITDFQFKTLKYNQKEDLHNPYLIAMGDVSHNWHQYF